MLNTRRGSATVEFAIIFPTLLMILVSMVDVTNMVTTSRRLQIVANSIAALVAATNSGSVTYADLEFAASSAMVLFPGVLSDSHAKNEAWSSDISISISSVVFKKTNPQCVASCAYTANVAWSGGAARRPCGINLTPVADTAPPSTMTLPTDAFGPGSVIVADVVYTFTPTFLTIAAVTFRKSSYIAPRYVPPSSYISYSVVTGDDGYAASCPGY